MSDGRAFTTYAPNCELMRGLQRKYKLSNSNELRLYMQKNADKVRDDLFPIDQPELVKCPVCEAALAYKA